MILWILIIFTIWRFFNVNTVAAWLMVPYLLWVTFAAYLNIAVAIMN
jgi:benzodiazapine receptor